MHDNNRIKTILNTFKEEKSRKFPLMSRKVCVLSDKRVNYTERNTPRLISHSSLSVVSVIPMYGTFSDNLLPLSNDNQAVFLVQMGNSENGRTAIYSSESFGHKVHPTTDTARSPYFHFINTSP